MSANLIDFIAAWHLEQGRNQICDNAKLALLDVLGVAVVGSSERASQIVASFALHEGGSGGKATVIGHGFQTGSGLAALVNGTSGHVLDFDPPSKKGHTGHPIVCVVPAALAAAECVAASGRELIEAIVVGTETVVQLGALFGGGAGAFYKRGFHGTSVFGIFGATAAAARLIDLSRHQINLALAIAASGSKGVRANYGTMTKALHAGEASQGGIVAAYLAKQGFTATTDIFGRAGWLDAMDPDGVHSSEFDEVDPANLVIDGGLNFKVFPSAGVGHAPLRAVLEVRSSMSLVAADIVQIEAWVPAFVLSQTMVISWPKTAMEGKFCLAFNLAAAWVDGRVDLHTFTEERLRALDPYQDRVAVHSSPNLDEVTVAVHLVGGGTVEIVKSMGGWNSDGSGVLKDALIQKFRNNLQFVDGDDRRAGAILEIVDNLELLPSISGLTALLSERGLSNG